MNNIKLVEVNEIPEQISRANQSFLKQFIDSGMKFCEITWNEHYKTLNSAYISISKSIKLHYANDIDITIRNKKIYLIRK